MTDEVETYEGVSAPAKRSKRGSVVPRDFAVTPAMNQWAITTGIRSNLNMETEKFVDHFTAKGEVKKDWVAAWRNWMRRADEWSPGRTSNGKHAAADALADTLFADVTR